MLVAVAGDQMTSNSRSGPAPDNTARSCCSLTGRATIAATDSTGRPRSSASSTDTAEGPAGAIRTRTADAPLACNDTRCQENGRTSSASGFAITAVCNAASRSAGCKPNPVTPPAASGNLTSANSSSPRAHIAVRPRNAGPYPYPRSASRW
uniref:Uncharacterized protein n=1 Tax=Mycobacterium kansasii TaxID=1768 RepID=A0A653F6R9_MYCKA|nr:hypothetical protein BIN_B_05318 [Mycobacterium kansasii]